MAAPSDVVNTLYKLADKMLDQPGNGPLPEEFGSRMVIYTLGYLQRARSVDGMGGVGHGITALQHAEHVFTWIWRRNAAWERRRAANDVRLVSLETVDEAVAGLAVSDKYPDAVAGNALTEAARCLQDAGWPAERAFALVLYYAFGEDYEETAVQLSKRFERKVTPVALRQWKRRYFKDGLLILRKRRTDWRLWE